MKTPRIANAVGHIDDDLIAGAAEYKKKNKNHWLKWGGLAACFAVFVITGAAILPSLFGENAAPGETDGRYKDYTIRSDEYVLLWPWEYQTVYEKYISVEIDGVEYGGQGRAVPEVLVGESIGNYTFVGYDEFNNGKKYTAGFEVYKLQDIAPSEVIAAKLGDDYYVYMKREYAPPKTLGELMDVVNLSKVVELKRFSENEKNPYDKHFTLNSDDYVWEILSECRNAPFIEDQAWTILGRNHLNFTVTSEALGAYKDVLYVTEDGYLETNAFHYQYLFYIGEEAAGKIIRYAKENSVEAEYEAYMNSVAGTIVEITEEYILVDDSVLCRNPSDGITYKVLLNDLRISRYVDHGVVKVGNTVLISYEGEIDKTDSNTIAGAISAYKATISDGDVLIPE